MARNKNKKQSVGGVDSSSASTAKAVQKQGVLYVRDNLAYAGPRTHDLVDSVGKMIRVTFESPDDEKALATDVAVRLISIDGFHVSREAGGPALRPVKLESVQRGLNPDETIAKYTELSNEALLHRSRVRGAEFKVGATRNEMIAFLMGGSIGDTSVEVTIEYEDDDAGGEEDGQPPEDAEPQDHAPVSFQTAEEIISNLNKRMGAGA